MGLNFDFSNLNKRLDDMAKKSQTSTLDKALDSGKEPILESMNKNVLVDTGELQGSLGEIKKTGSGRKRTSLLGINSNDRNVIERGYYAEYGTECQVASHWMKKSFIEAKEEAKTRMIQTLKEELNL